MSDSILISIKKLLGIDSEYRAFDQDVLFAINSSFTILNQLGVGPDRSYRITGDGETWSDFFADKEFIDLAKDYIYLRVRLLFDPPSTGVLHEAIERQISEFEWRLMVQADWNNEHPALDKPAGPGDFENPDESKEPEKPEEPGDELREEVNGE